MVGIAHKLLRGNHELYSFTVWDEKKICCGSIDEYIKPYPILLHSGNYKWSLGKKNRLIETVKTAASTRKH